MASALAAHDNGESINLRINITTISNTATQKHQVLCKQQAIEKAPAALDQKV